MFFFEVAAIHLFKMLLAGIHDPSAVTEEKIASSLLHPAMNFNTEDGLMGYRIVCELLALDNLDVNAVNRWYFYGTCPMQQSVEEKAELTAPEAVCPAAALELLRRYFANLELLLQCLNLLFLRLTYRTLGGCKVSRRPHALRFAFVHMHANRSANADAAGCSAQPAGPGKRRDTDAAGTGK